jgi:hypothetical protein
LIYYLTVLNFPFNILATQTKCEKLHASANSGLIGAFVPQCKATGEFEEKQCWGSTGFCWCVDKDGKELLGTKIRGSPDCSKKGTWKYTIDPLKQLCHQS